MSLSGRIGTRKRDGKKARSQLLKKRKVKVQSSVPKVCTISVTASRGRSIKKIAALVKATGVPRHPRLPYVTAQAASLASALLPRLTTFTFCYKAVAARSRAPYRTLRPPRRW